MQEQIKDTIILQGLFHNDYIFFKGNKYIIEEFICGSYDIFSKCTDNIVINNIIGHCDCSNTRNVYDAVINKQKLIDNLQNCTLDIVLDTNDEETIKFIVKCSPEVSETKYIKMKKPATIILKRC